MQIIYFLISMLGGFFIIAIPWSGLLLIMAKREPKPVQPKQK